MPTAKHLDPSGHPVALRIKGGKGPRIFRQKRGHSRYDAEWYMRYRVGAEGGKGDFLFRLGDDLRKAEDLAWAIKGRLMAGEAPKAIQASLSGETQRKQDAKLATIGDVLDALTTAAPNLELKPRTLAGYKASLLRVVIASGGKGAKASSAILAAKAVDAYKTAMTANLTGERLRQAKRTVNSVLRNARALFG